jgi:hypothetical protein
MIDRRRVLAFALAMLPTLAAAQDSPYRFEVVEAPARRGSGQVIRVHVTDRLGAPIGDLTPRSGQLDRTSPASGAAVAAVTVAPGGGYGLYGFRTDLHTDGDYALQMEFTRPGDPAPVVGVVTFSITRPRPPTDTRARPR